MEEIQTIIYAQTFEKGKEVMKVVDITSEKLETTATAPMDKEEAYRMLEQLTKQLETIKEVLGQ